MYLSFLYATCGSCYEILHIWDIHVMNGHIFFLFFRAIENENKLQGARAPLAFFAHVYSYHSPSLNVLQGYVTMNHEN